MASGRTPLSDAPLGVWFFVGLVAFAVGEVATLMFVGLPPDGAVLITAFFGGLAFACVATGVVAIIRVRRRGRGFGAVVSTAVRQRRLPAQTSEDGWLRAFRLRQVLTVAVAVVVPPGVVVLAVPGVFVARNADTLRAGLYWGVTGVLILLALLAIWRLIRHFMVIHALVSELRQRDGEREGERNGQHEVLRDRQQDRY